MRRYLPAIVLGGILGLAFPPFPLGFIAYFALAPLLYWMQRDDIKSHFAMGYWWGFGFHTAGIYWIVNSTVAGGIGTLLFVPCFSGLVLLLMRYLYRSYGKIVSLALFPFVWTAVEYIRTVGAFAFSWLSIGYTQTYYLPLIQYAEYVGVHGVILWICLINILFYLIYIRVEEYWRFQDQAALRPAWIIALMIVVLFAVPWIHGSISMESGVEYGETLRVSLVQGHVDLAQKRGSEFTDNNFQRYDTLTKETFAYNPDLIIWPETATMVYLRRNTRFKQWFKKIVRESGTSLLTGSHDVEIHEDGSYTTYNSAYLMNRPDEGIENSEQWYAKMRLVPFGEWFPYEDKLTWFDDIDLGQASFKPGKTYNNLLLEKTRKTPVERITEDDEILPKTLSLVSESIELNVAICFESIFPDFIRTFVQNGSQFLVTISNVNWFGKTTSLYQHVQIGVFRAIENRYGIAHCSNSGVSVIIDPYGKVTNQSGVFVSEVLNGEVYYRSQDKELTFFTRHGELVALFSLFVTLLFLLTAPFYANRRVENLAMKTFFTILVVLLLLPVANAFSQSNEQYVNLSNSRARALAMGGAFIAVEDNFASVSFNPGSFSLFRDRSAFHYTIGLNPVLPIISFSQREHFKNSSEGLRQGLDFLKFAIKSIGVSYKLLDVGLLFHEEGITERGEPEFFLADSFERNNYHTAVARFRMTSQISLGVSGSYITYDYNGVEETGSGFSYGILLKPNESYQVGVMYTKLSEGVKLSRKRFDRLADESLNAGVTIKPVRDVLFSIDVRNFTENDSEYNFGLQEFHFGFEVNKIPHVSFRGGYYIEDDEGLKSDIYSLGLGLVDLNRFKAYSNQFTQQRTVLSYALLLEDSVEQQVRWHMLSLGFQF